MNERAGSAETPAAEPSGTALSTPVEDLHDLESPRRWLLCVVEDPAILEEIREALPRDTFPVSCVGDTETARGRLARIRFDLLMLDRSIEGASDLRAEIRRLYPRLPLLELTTRDPSPASEDDAVLVVERGRISERLRPAVEKMLARVESSRAATENDAITGVLFRDRAAGIHNVLFSTMNEGCLLLDAEGLITFANEAAARIFQSGLEDLLGRRVQEFLDTATRVRLRDFEREATEKSATHSTSFEGRITRGRGDSRPVFCSLRALRGKSGRVEGSVLVVADISELAATRDALRSRIAELERFQRFFIDREARIVELKSRIRELERRLGIASPGLSEETRQELAQRLKARRIVP